VIVSVDWVISDMPVAQAKPDLANIRHRSAHLKHPLRAPIGDIAS
jgi:hypothetical protein